jgi:protein TonB
MSAVFPPQGGFSFPVRSEPVYQRPGAGQNRGFGLALVVLLHVLLGWALASGLARKAVEFVKKPIEMTIVPEEAPPPPPPPPKIEKIQPTPKVQALPPPFVPPPDIAPPVEPIAPVIQAAQAEPPKEPVVIAPPTPPAPAPEPKPVAVKQEISVACPGYQNVLAQTLEEAIDRVGIAGNVRTLIKLRGNQVVDAIPQSGPKEYYKYVQSAIKRMRCSSGGADEVQVLLDVNFKR